MIQKLTQLLTNLKYKLFPKSKPVPPIKPIDLINKHDRAYKKTHWI